MSMDKDFMLIYHDKKIRPTWTELLKTPRYQPAASKRDAIEREFFRMLNDEQKRVYIIYTVRQVQESLCCARSKGALAKVLYRSLKRLKRTASYFMERSSVKYKATTLFVIL